MPNISEFVRGEEMIYEYNCDNEECGKFWEEGNKSAEAEYSVCPQCQCSGHRLISRSSFVVKGGHTAANGYSKTSA